MPITYPGSPAYDLLRRKLARFGVIGAAANVFLTTLDTDVALSLNDSNFSAIVGTYIPVQPPFFNPGVGAPLFGTWSAGQQCTDSTGAEYVCAVGGTPGTWVPLGSGTFAPAAAVAATTTDSIASRNSAPLISSGSMQSGGTFGVAVRYQDTNRRKIIIQNVSGVSVQIAYAATGTRNQPTWGSPTATLAPGQEFVDYNRGDPVWFRDSGGTVVTVKYVVELGA